MNAPRQVILASHLIWTGYGHWLPNDPRGSGSHELRNDDLSALGPIHEGRKNVQPPRDALKSFYRSANQILDHTPIWFDQPTRDLIGAEIGRAAHDLAYVVHALAVCSNHVRAIIRSHRDRSETIWRNLAQRTREALLRNSAIPPTHPLWATRPYKVFLRTPADVQGRIRYVNENPVKERLPAQHWDFIQPYDSD